MRRVVVVVVFASFQLCLSDKISFFFNIASFISYFNSLLAAYALRQPRPSRRSALPWARACDDRVLSRSRVRACVCILILPVDVVVDSTSLAGADGDCGAQLNLQFNF